MSYTLYKSFSPDYYFRKFETKQEALAEAAKGHHDLFPGEPLFYFEDGTSDFVFLKQGLTTIDALKIRG